MKDMKDMKEMRAASLKAKAERLSKGLSAVADPMERARNNPTSFRHAITAKCWDCQGGNADPHPRWRIGNCTMPDCPLWNLRPYQKYYGLPIPKGLETE